jgi:hypothetical protein
MPWLLLGSELLGSENLQVTFLRSRALATSLVTSHRIPEAAHRPEDFSRPYFLLFALETVGFALREERGRVLRVDGEGAQGEFCRVTWG